MPKRRLDPAAAGVRRGTSLPGQSHTQQDFIRLTGPLPAGRQKASRGGRWREGPGQSRRGQPTRRSEDWRRARLGQQRPAIPRPETEQGPAAPWTQQRERYSRGIVGLHEEIEDFYQYMSPSAEEHRMRTAVFEAIRNVIQGIWSRAEVHIFGSFETGLYLPTSDIDLVVFGKWVSPPLDVVKEALLRAGICDPDTVKVLHKAAVPIVKLTDRRTRIKVDISFNMDNGLISANRIKRYIAEYPHLPKLVMPLKQLLLQRELNEVFTGGVSSYGVILLVLSFLQTHERRLAVFPGCNLGVLLIEFFELYGVKFNYPDICIRVAGKGYAPRSKMEDQFIGTAAHNSPLCIEDPHNPTNDIGRSSYNMLKVKEAFCFAYHRLRFSVLDPGPGGDPNCRSLLGQIVSVPESVVDYRRWVSTTFPAEEAPSRQPVYTVSTDSGDKSDTWSEEEEEDMYR